MGLFWASKWASQFSAVQVGVVLFIFLVLVF